jgi:hypothetical protein
MQDSGASTLDVLQTFLVEAQIIVEYFADCVPREQMLRAINEFSAACEGLVVPPPAHRARAH